jgi:hypothetical protein
MLQCGQVGGKRRVRCHQHSTAETHAAFCITKQQKTPKTTATIIIIIISSSSSIGSSSSSIISIIIRGFLDRKK